MWIVKDIESLRSELIRVHVQCYALLKYVLIADNDGSFHFFSINFSFFVIIFPPSTHLRLLGKILQIHHGDKYENVSYFQEKAKRQYRCEKPGKLI